MDFPGCLIDISLELLYSLILGQENRIFNLEKQVDTLEEQNSNLNGKIEILVNRPRVSVSQLEQVSQDLAITSEGVAKLENFRGTCETRLSSLEMPPEVLTEDSEMVLGEDTALTRVNTKIEQIQRELKEHIEKMGSFNSNQQKENRRRHLECEHQEQYTRRDCVIVKGVPYKRDEDTTDIVCRIAYSMGVMITQSDISTSHRTGRQVGQSPRPIICRFARRDTKYKIMNSRYETRHIKTDDDGNPVRIFIDENLTQMRGRVCKKLRDEKVPHRVKDGKIHLLTAGENPSTEKTLDTASDWESLA